MNSLGELCQRGHTVEQHVLNAPHCRISYTLWPLGSDDQRLGKTISAVGGRPIPPDLHEDAERVIATRRAELIAMLQSAQHGPFHAAQTGFVVGELRDPDGAEIRVFYTGWQDVDLVISSTSPSLPYDHAFEVARAQWADVPEEVRKRLMRVARPHEE